jgi:hypothetical protein
VALGNAGDLHVTDVGQPAPHLHRQVALHDLRVVQVHLHAKVGCARFLADGVRFGLRVEEVPWNVARVDRLDQRDDAGALELGAGMTQVLQVRAPAGCAVGARRQQTGHDVQPRGAERARVIERGGDSGAKLRFAAGERRETALARLPVARRQVEQHAFQLCCAQRGRHLVRRVCVGKKKLHAAEPGGRGGGEALQERNLLEHHAEVGGEARHAQPLRMRGIIVDRIVDNFAHAVENRRGEEVPCFAF